MRDLRKRHIIVWMRAARWLLPPLLTLATVGCWAGRGGAASSRKDFDGDGVNDAADPCALDPEDFDKFEDTDGCPEPDNDRDGVADAQDECPNRAGDCIDREPTYDEEYDDYYGYGSGYGSGGYGTGGVVGGALGGGIDTDGDGVVDTADACPSVPEDMDGFQDQDGCPDPDNDSDRILDGDDQCPDDAETYNGENDEDGCPDTGVLQVEEGVIVLFEQIHFRTDSAEIDPTSFPLLDTIARALAGNPHITLVEVQGHADDRGSDEYNIRLTRDRAASVVLAVTRRGIDPARLRSAGYGERCPIDPAHSTRARALNRRVEIKILRTLEGPTDVLLACEAGAELTPP
jgi:outer membrane protein OmpA-like peptidoglycan-associated protein